MVPAWRVTVAPHRSCIDPIRPWLPLGTRIEVPAWKYSRKLICLARSGVAVIEEMITSNFLAWRSGMSSSKPVLTKVKRTPRARPSSFARSGSMPLTCGSGSPTGRSSTSGAKAS